MLLVALSTCGHVLCKKFADTFMVADKVCMVCNKACKGRNMVNLLKGGKAMEITLKLGISSIWEAVVVWGLLDLQ